MNSPRNVELPPWYGQRCTQQSDVENAAISQFTWCLFQIKPSVIVTSDTALYCKNKLTLYDIDSS